MTVYIDKVFLLNTLVDYLLLLCAGRLAGEALSRKRLAVAAGLGGAYAAAVWLPGLSFLRGTVWILAAGAGMVLTAFGLGKRSLRLGLIFLGTAAAFGGGVLALGRLSGGGVSLDLKALLLSAAGCYAFLTLIFRGGARHAGGELAEVELALGKRTCRLTALVDTGNTLSDPLTGRSVMVAEGEKMAALFPSGEGPTAEEMRDPVGAVSNGRGDGRRWRLLPYRAVGVECALLLAVKVDSARIGGEDYGPILVALSPTPLSDGGGYNALIGA